MGRLTGERDVRTSWGGTREHEGDRRVNGRMRPTAACPTRALAPVALAVELALDLSAPFL